MDRLIFVEEIIDFIYYQCIFVTNNSFAHWITVSNVFALIKDKRIRHHSNHNLYCCFLIIGVNVDIIKIDGNLLIAQ